ncbi:MAG TPA: permease, partial [Polaromonas sp.]|nr:permease [Polaromonas sp.]
MLAHLQKLITALVVAAACGWLLYFGSSAPMLAVAG